MTRDQILVDEAARESFPASDPPSWTPTHAGMPARRSTNAETPRELRSMLHDDLARLVAGGREARAETLASTFLDSGPLVVRIPVDGTTVAAPEVIELLIRGTDTEATEELVIATRYDSNPTGAAVLLGLARVLTGVRFERTVRLVALADGRRGGESYARRLCEQHVPLRGAISLDSVGFLIDRNVRPWLASRLFRPWQGTFMAFVGDRRSRAFVEDVRRAFSLGTRLEARSFAVPTVLPLVTASDQRTFSLAGFPALLVTDTGPLRNRHPPSASDLLPKVSFDAMADVVFGLAAVAARLAGGAHSAGSG